MNTKLVKDNDTPYTGTRRGDGGTYLIIYDDQDEFQIACHYAARVALARRGYLAIAHVTDLDDFMHWGKVEAMILKDLRREAEKKIWQAAKFIHEEYNLRPSLHICEGKRIDNIVDIIDNHRQIRALILAGSNTAGNPGPLVSYFSSKGLSRLRVPTIIVPGHLDKEAIEAIT